MKRNMMGGDRRAALFVSGVLAISLALPACSSNGSQSDAETEAGNTASADDARHPVSGLEVAEIVVTTGQDRHRFKTEIARSPADQSQGLMFREALLEMTATLRTHTTSL